MALTIDNPKPDPPAALSVIPLFYKSESKYGASSHSVYLCRYQLLLVWLVCQ